MAANDAGDIPAKDAMILWRPMDDGAVPVRVVRAGQDEQRYMSAGGAAYRHWKEASDSERMLMMMLAFHTLVVGERIPPADVHKAFLAMPEYRSIISPDIDGAD